MIQIIEIFQQIINIRIIKMIKIRKLMIKLLIILTIKIMKILISKNQGKGKRKKCHKLVQNLLKKNRILQKISIWIILTN